MTLFKLMLNGLCMSVDVNIILAYMCGAYVNLSRHCL